MESNKLDLMEKLGIFLFVWVITLTSTFLGLGIYEKYLEVQAKYGKLCQPERPQPDPQHERGTSE